MSKRLPLMLAIAGSAIAALAIVWPMRAHHATWAVTVGSEQTTYTQLDGGELVTAIQLLIGGTAPEETATRSALRNRLLVGAAAGALALGAGLWARSRRGVQ